MTENKLDEQTFEDARRVGLEIAEMMKSVKMSPSQRFQAKRMVKSMFDNVYGPTYDPKFPLKYAIAFGTLPSGSRGPVFVFQNHKGIFIDAMILVLEKNSQIVTEVRRLTKEDLADAEPNPTEPKLH